MFRLRPLHRRPWALGFLVLGGCSDEGPLLPAILESFDDPDAFAVAIGPLGAATIIDFEDVDAGQVNNDLAGRTPFDGDFYQSQGVRFSSPDGFDLFIAPGGLFWNTSHSLSVGKFPYGTEPNAPDNLNVTLSVPATAVGFTLVDNGGPRDDESVQFLDQNGDIIQEVDLPADFTSYRAFVGLVSSPRWIASVRIIEADDGDDVNYDDFIIVRPN